MKKRISSRQNNSTVDFLGSAHVFTSALTDVMERKVVDQVSDGELTFEQVKVLQLLAKPDGHNVSDVAAFMRVSNAAASKSIEKLVRMKLLQRSEGKTDRRAAHLFLTDAGQRLLTKYGFLRLRAFTRITEGIPREDIQNLSRTLDKLSARIVSQILGSNNVCLQCGIHLRERCVLNEETGGLCTYRRRRGDL